MTQPPLCDDCAPADLKSAGGPKCYAFCTGCGIKRACFGDDPDPLPVRVPRYRPS